MKIAINYCRFFAVALTLVICAAVLPCRAGDEMPVGIGEELLRRQPKPNALEADTCRGKYLRTETRNTRVSSQLGCALVVAGEYRQPALRLALKEIREITEVRIYELELREFVPDDNGVTGSFVNTVVSDQVWEGEKNTRTETRPGRVLANATVTVNGTPCRTDEQGIVLDRNGNILDLLSMLDNLSNRTAKLSIKVASVQLPPLEYTIFRTMPQRSTHDEKRLEEPPEQDVLIASGLDFTLSKFQPEQEKLICTAHCGTESVKTAGIPFPVSVTVENQGSAATSCLLGRSFSRIPGLNGKLFYFGAVPPGEKRTFTRWMTVDADTAVNDVFLEIRFSDSWSIPDKKIPINLTVIHTGSLLTE